jgi:hypothetical protein
MKWGIIERIPNKKHNPYVLYYIRYCRLESPSKILNNFSNSFKFPFTALKILKTLAIKPQTPKMLREKLKIKERTLRYYLNKLSFIIRCGGNNCRYAYLILSPVKITHKHKYTKYHKRYRRWRSRNLTS